MLTVYKYPVPIPGRENLLRVSLPLVWKFLRIGKQEDDFYMWILMDPDSKEREPYHIRVFGTGRSIEDGWKHLATVQDDWFVWHWFIDKYPLQFSDYLAPPRSVRGTTPPDPLPRR